MKILALTTFLPVPLDQGDPVRVLNVLKALADAADLTVLAVRRRDTSSAHEEELRDQLSAASVEIFDLSPEWASQRPRTWKLARGVLGVVRRRPPWILNHASRDARRRLYEISAGFDLVVLLGEGAGHYASASRTRTLWDKSNVLVASSRAAVNDLDDASQRLKALLSWPLGAGFEKAALAHVQDVWVTSEADAERLQAHYRRTPLAVVKSVAPEVHSVAEIDPGSSVFYWMSSLAYPPNLDGLVRMLDAAAPGMSERGQTLRVVGSGGNADIERKLERFGVVDFVGYAEDLAESARGVSAAVVPLWAGAGVKLKTLTLMNLGIPVIATPVAMEGIDHDLAWEIAHDPSDFELLMAKPRDPDAVLRHSTRVREAIGFQHSVDALRRQVATEVGRIEAMSR